MGRFTYNFPSMWNTNLHVFIKLEVLLILHVNKFFVKMSYLYSNSRFSNSLAKDTLVRMSYSIGEKIVKSMAVVPVTYGRKDIDVFKKNKPVPKTQKISPKAVPDQASKSIKDSTSKSLKKIGIGPRFSKYMT